MTDSLCEEIILDRRQDGGALPVQDSGDNRGGLTRLGWPDDRHRRPAPLADTTPGLLVAGFSSQQTAALPPEDEPPRRWPANHERREIFPCRQPRPHRNPKAVPAARADPRGKHPKPQPHRDRSLSYERRDGARPVDHRPRQTTGDLRRPCGSRIRRVGRESKTGAERMTQRRPHESAGAHKRRQLCARPHRCARQTDNQQQNRCCFIAAKRARRPVAHDATITDNRLSARRRR